MLLTVTGLKLQVLQCKYFPRPFNQVPAGTGALANVAHVTSTSGAGYWGLGALVTGAFETVAGSWRVGALNILSASKRSLTLRQRRYP